MTTIYGAPEEIKVPKFSIIDYGTYKKKCEQYVEELRKYCLEDNDSKNVGEILRFQVADGYAEYMIASMKPLELIHIPIGDAYEFQYAHLLNAKEVNAQLARQNALNKIFKKI